MSDLCLAQARSIVFEGQVVLIFVYAKAAKAIGISEFAEPAKLFEAQRRLELIRDFEECHRRKYTGKEQGRGSERV